MRITLCLATGLLCTLLLGGCASTLSDEGWEDWGGFTLTDNQYAVHHRVRDGAHRLELLRKSGDRDGGTVRWDILDAVPLDVPESALVCLTASRAGERADYVALAEDDAAHSHHVLKAWRVDTSRRKLVSADVGGVTCHAAEEPRTR
jgi:hypothetical protein